MKPLISIIIPCYNVEKYIDRCLESVVNQTIGIENLEVLCVNDASTDGTLNKLHSWERRYPNEIAVITYEVNQRQGGARNIGMKYANAEYFGFIDADDWIEPEMYEELYKVMALGKYDMVACKYIRDKGDNRIEINRSARNDKEFHFDKKDGLYWSEIYDEADAEFWGGVTTRLFKRSIIMDNHIEYPIGMTYEDNYFINIVNLYVSSIYLIDRIYYHYYVNCNSTVTTRNSAHQLDRLKIEVMLLEKYIELGAFESFYCEIFFDFMNRYYLNTMLILFTRFDDIPMVYDEMKDTVVRYYPDWYELYPLDMANPAQRMLLEFLKNHDSSNESELIELRGKFLAALSE